MLNANSFMRIGKAFPWHVEGKVKFIEDNVYCKDRNHSNWISFEWKYRKKLDNVIHVDHSIYSASYAIAPRNGPSKPHKILGSILDPEDCLKHYLKFNPTLNSFSPKEFLRKSINYNKHIEEYPLHLRPGEQILIVRGKELHKPDLDRKLYKSMIDFFELEDLYEYANQVHIMWYKIHTENDIGRDY